MLITSQRRSSKTSLRRDLITQAISNTTSGCVGDLYSDSAYSPYIRFNEQESGEVGGTQIFADDQVSIADMPRVVAASDNYYIIHRKGSTKLEFYKRFGANTWQLIHTDNLVMPSAQNTFQVTQITSDNTVTVSSPNTSEPIYQYSFLNTNVTKTQIKSNMSHPRIVGNGNLGKMATSRNGKYAVLFHEGNDTDSNSEVAYTFFEKDLGTYILKEQQNIGKFASLPIAKTTYLGASEFLSDEGFFGIYQAEMSGVYFYRLYPEGQYDNRYQLVGIDRDLLRVNWMSADGQNFISDNKRYSFLLSHGVDERDEPAEFVGNLPFTLKSERMLSPDGLQRIDIIPKTQPSAEKANINIRRSFSWTSYNDLIEQTWQAQYPSTYTTNMSSSSNTIVSIDAIVDGSLAQYSIQTTNNDKVAILPVDLTCLIECNSTTQATVIGDIDEITSLISTKSRFKVNDYADFIDSSNVNIVYRVENGSNLVMNDEFAIVDSFSAATIPYTKVWTTLRRFGKNNWKNIGWEQDSYSDTWPGYHSNISTNNEWCNFTSEGNVFKIYRYNTSPEVNEWEATQIIGSVTTSEVPRFSYDGKWLVIHNYEGGTQTSFTYYERNETTLQYDLIGTANPTYAYVLPRSDGNSPIGIANDGTIATWDTNSGNSSFTRWNGSEFEYQDVISPELGTNQGARTVSKDGTVALGRNATFKKIDDVWTLTDPANGLNNKNLIVADENLLKVSVNDKVYYSDNEHDSWTLTQVKATNNVQALSQNGYFNLYGIYGQGDVSVLSTLQSSGINEWKSLTEASSSTIAALGYERNFTGEISAETDLVSDFVRDLSFISVIDASSTTDSNFVRIRNAETDINTISTTDSNFVRIRNAETDINTISTQTSTHNYFRDFDSLGQSVSTAEATHIYTRNFDTNIEANSVVISTVGFKAETDIICHSDIISQTSRDTTIASEIGSTSSFTADTDFILNSQAEINARSSLLGTNDWSGETIITASSDVSNLLERYWVTESPINNASSVTADTSRIRIFNSDIDCVSQVDNTPIVDGSMVTVISANSSLDNTLFGSLRFISTLEATSTIPTSNFDRDWILDTQIDNVSETENNFVRIREATTQIDSVSLVDEYLIRDWTNNTLIVDTSSVTSRLAGTIIMSSGIYGVSTVTADIIVEGDINDLVLSWTLEQDIREPSKTLWIADINTNEIEDDFIV